MVYHYSSVVYLLVYYCDAYRRQFGSRSQELGNDVVLKKDYTKKSPDRETFLYRIGALSE